MTVKAAVTVVREWGDSVLLDPYDVHRLSAGLQEISRAAFTGISGTGE